jgi:tryptophan-rich sensory protein
MKFREIKCRFRTESAFLSPVILGIAAGITVLLGAIFTMSLVGRPFGVLLPRTALPSFFHILFQLLAYAIFGAAFASLLTTPLCQKTRRLRLQKAYALVLFVCVLILCYVWIPVVYKAGSYFLGVLLCGVILLSLFVLFFLTYRLNIISAGLLALFAVWMLYILYITISFLFFC